MSKYRVNGPGHILGAGKEAARGDADELFSNKKKYIVAMARKMEWEMKVISSHFLSES